MVAAAAAAVAVPLAARGGSDLGKIYSEPTVYTDYNDQPIKVASPRWADRDSFCL